MLQPVKSLKRRRSPDRWGLAAVDELEGLHKILQQVSQGHVFSVLDGPEVDIEVKEAAITLEPAGGSAQPTWPMIASSGK